MTKFNIVTLTILIFVGLVGSGPAADDQKLPHHGNRIDHDALVRAGSEQLAVSPARLWRVSPHVHTRSWNWHAKRIHRGALSQPFSTRAGEGFKDYAALYVIDEPTIGLLMANAKAIIEYQARAPKGGAVKQLLTWGRSPNLPTPTEKAGSETCPTTLIEAAIRAEFNLVLHRQPTLRLVRRWVESSEPVERNRKLSA